MLFRSPSFFYSIASFCELVKPDPTIFPTIFPSLSFLHYLSYSNSIIFIYLVYTLFWNDRRMDSRVRGNDIKGRAISLSVNMYIAMLTEVWACLLFFITTPYFFDRIFFVIFLHFIFKFCC